MFLDDNWESVHMFMNTHDAKDCLTVHIPELYYLPFLLSCAICDGTLKVTCFVNLTTDTKYMFVITKIDQTDMR